ncbi:MAG TPA: modified peptide precursor CbpA [Victivallales bacterium]|nr:modified peptide precursor CbpA [Victivallales bacterium]
MQKEKTTKDQKEKEEISFRKTCNPKGTGLSHYIVIDDKKEK